MTKDEKNHHAYEDVIDGIMPSMPWDEEYMHSYRSWNALVPDREDYWEE